MATVYDVSDYVIFRSKAEGNADLSALKHQKLLYYIQAWHLAFFGKPAFESEFQAWIHGPVNKEIYDLYKNTKYLYSEMLFEDIQDKAILENLDSDMKMHIDNILDSYARFSATQLEEMTHSELPWIEARKGFKPSQRCEVNINNTTMQNYYAARLTQ